MGMIRARISDELEERIHSIIEEIKDNAVGGVEINLSTVIRYSLENYVKEYENNRKGINSVNFDFDSFTLEQINEIKEPIKRIAEIKDIESISNGQFKKEILKAHHNSYFKAIEKMKGVIVDEK